MANLEIERKFLVRSTDWGMPVSTRPMEQGYLFIGTDRNLRIRRSGGDYLLTLKVRAEGIGRHEIETPIDPGQGHHALTRLCVAPPLAKVRHVVEHAGIAWDVDVFVGANAGLILAEIELVHQDQAFERPGWLGPEVTGDRRFFNEYLARHPFLGWGVSYRDLLGRISGGG
jgi:adenylate cyclase